MHSRGNPLQLCTPTRISTAKPKSDCSLFRFLNTSYKTLWAIEDHLCVSSVNPHPGGGLKVKSFIMGNRRSSLCVSPHPCGGLKVKSFIMGNIRSSICVCQPPSKDKKVRIMSNSAQGNNSEELRVSLSKKERRRTESLGVKTRANLHSLDLFQLYIRASRSMRQI
jgi:hypothetical protein